MQKKFFIIPNGISSIKKVVAFFIATIMLFCSLPLTSIANDTTDISGVFSVGNGIYLGAYRHATEISSDGSVVTHDNNLSPILWQVISVEGNEAVLASVYILDMADKNYISYLTPDSFLGSDNSLFLAQEEELIKSVSILSDTDSLGNIRAPLKDSNFAMSWWLEDGYYVNDEGNLSNFPDVNDAIHGFRPVITIDIATAEQTISYATPESGTRKYDLTFSYGLGGPDLIKSELETSITEPSYAYTSPLTSSESGLITPDFGTSSSTIRKDNNSDTKDENNSSNDSNSDKNSTSTNNSNNPISSINGKNKDYGIVVDYVDEVIRLIDIELTDGKPFVEVGNKTVSDTYKTLTEQFSANEDDTGVKVEFMYALKATPENSLSGDQKTKMLHSEKWYPMYGDTIDISKLLPKNDRSAYYIAVRRADDIFDSQSGYESRQTVQLKSRNPDSQFKKQIRYDPETEMFILASGEVDVLYRMNYFTTLVQATLSSTNGISVPSHIYPLGGVLYVSSMPVMNNGEVVMAASNPIKISVPKSANAPSVKVDLASKKISSLKRSTTEFSYNGKENWTTYNESSTSIDLKNIYTHFPNIAATEDDNYILYFRTKATAKTPASEAKKLLIPKSFVDAPEVTENPTSENSTEPTVAE